MNDDTINFETNSIYILKISYILTLFGVNRGLVLCKYYNYACFLLLFLFAVSIKYAYSETERVKYNGIRMAYVNDYYEALHLNLETIKPLR